MIIMIKIAPDLSKQNLPDDVTDCHIFGNIPGPLFDIIFEPTID